jgi:hypothetical protein
MDTPLPIYSSQGAEDGQYETVPGNYRNWLVPGQPPAQASTATPQTRDDVGGRIVAATQAAGGNTSLQNADGFRLAPQHPLPGTLPGVDTNQNLNRTLGQLGSVGLAPPPWSPVKDQLEKEGRHNVEAHTPPDTQDRKYRMGIGQRILGSLVNFAGGFSHNGLPPVYVGPGALNSRYYRDQKRQQDEAERSDARLNSLRRSLEAEETLRQQIIDKQDAESATGVQEETATTSNQADSPTASAQESQESSKASPTDYERAAVAAAMETDPVKRAEMEQGLRMMERIERGRATGKIKPPAKATDGLTAAEQKQFNDQVYGIQQRIAALERVGSSPQIDAALQRLYQQRDAVANGIKAGRGRARLHRNGR